MKKLIRTKFISVILLCYNMSSYSQHVISGHISNGENNQPVVGASIFISNTSKGTVSNNSGDFLLADVPEGRHELVVSSVGYETFVKSFSSEELPLKLNVTLKLKVKELEGVTVAPFEKDGWEKWGRTFMENFIGTGENAAACKISNYKTIRFRFSKKDSKLTAIAYEPLRISNKALGYNIQYQLENFEIDFNNHSMVYLGYPLLEEMKGDKKKWKKARLKAYSGSMMHFIRCIYNNTLLEEGFEVKRLKKILNVEKARVREIYKPVSKTKKDEKTGEAITVLEYSYERFPKDSIDYFERVLRQKDFFDIYGDSFLTADSIASADSNKVKYLVFEDYLSVTFKNQKEEKNYLQYIMEENRKPFYQRSSLILTGEGFVIIENSGNYFNPLNLLSMGYWGWREKIANLLPYDFVPAQ